MTKVLLKRNQSKHPKHHKTIYLTLQNSFSLFIPPTIVRQLLRFNHAIKVQKALGRDRCRRINRYWSRKSHFLARKEQSITHQSWSWQGSLDGKMQNGLEVRLCIAYTVPYDYTSSTLLGWRLWPIPCRSWFRFIWWDSSSCLYEAFAVTSSNTERQLFLFSTWNKEYIGGAAPRRSKCRSQTCIFLLFKLMLTSNCSYPR